MPTSRPLPRILDESRAFWDDWRYFAVKDGSAGEAVMREG